jgi:hypothetical protein
MTVLTDWFLQLSSDTCVFFLFSLEYVLNIKRTIRQLDAWCMGVCGAKDAFFNHLLTSACGGIGGSFRLPRWPKCLRAKNFDEMLVAELPKVGDRNGMLFTVPLHNYFLENDVFLVYLAAKI